MPNKNPYSDREFYKNYINDRKQRGFYSDLLERPTVFSLLGDVKNKVILDIGCGDGAMDSVLAKLGAKSVLGVDISSLLIEKAVAENNHPNIKFMKLDVKQLSNLENKFDIIISSLAFHYMRDFSKLFKDAAKVLKRGGLLVFSIDHPISTASKYEQDWAFEPDGSIRSFSMDNYEMEAERVMEWLERPVVKYHHKMETIINALIDAGFCIERVLEPCPTASMREQNPKMNKELHRPIFLIIRCSKK